MADNVIDRLVSSLAAGHMDTEEFIDAIESRVGMMRSTTDGSTGDSPSCYRRGTSAVGREGVSKA
jgi:hypothetical protein